MVKSKSLMMAVIFLLFLISLFGNLLIDNKIMEAITLYVTVVGGALSLIDFIYIQGEYRKRKNVTQNEYFNSLAWSIYIEKGQLVQEYQEYLDAKKMVESDFKDTEKYEELLKQIDADIADCSHRSDMVKSRQEKADKLRIEIERGAKKIEFNGKAESILTTIAFLLPAVVAIIYHEAYFYCLTYQNEITLASFAVILLSYYLKSQVMDKFETDENKLKEEKEKADNEIGRITERKNHHFYNL